MAEWDVSQTIAALGGVGNLPATNEVPIDMHQAQFEAWPEETALTTILGKLSSGNAKNVRIDWTEVQQIPTTVRIAGPLAAGGVALLLTANGLSVVTDSLLFNERTFDMARAAAGATDTAVTIVRGAGGTTAAAWIVGDILHVLPPDVPEDDNDTVRDSAVSNTNLFNYVQLVRLGFRCNRTLLNLSPYPGFPTFLQNLQVAKYREYRLKKEKSHWMGGRAALNPTLTTVRRQSGGVIERLRNGTLYKDYTGIITESGFENHLGEYFDTNPTIDRPAVLMAPNVYRIVARFNKQAIQTSIDATKWGIPNLKEYQIGGKTVNLVQVPQFIGPYSKGWYFVLDFSRMILKTMTNDTYHPDPGLMYNKSERAAYMYRGQWSLLVANEQCHSMAVNALN
jgi:hypothetical protein